LSVHDTGEDGVVDGMEGAEPVVATVEEIVDTGLTVPVRMGSMAAGEVVMSAER
jgi:hypothetical protein